MFEGTECLLSGGLVVPRTVLMAAHPAGWDRVTEMKSKRCPANTPAHFVRQPNSGQSQVTVFGCTRSPVNELCPRWKLLIFEQAVGSNECKKVAIRQQSGSELASPL